MTASLKKIKTNIVVGGSMIETPIEQIKINDLVCGLNDAYGVVDDKINIGLNVVDLITNRKSDNTLLIKGHNATTKQDWVYRRFIGRNVLKFVQNN